MLRRLLPFVLVVVCWMPCGIAAADEPKAAAAAADERRSVADDEYYELYKVFADTLHQVEQNYVKEISRRELMEAAIQGVLQKLDPYSNYISPEEIGRFRSSVDNEFGGIGIQITMEAGQLKVLSPLVGTPAYRAGLQAGDHIVEIEGESTEGISIDKAVERLKGEPGSSVTITVYHPRSKQRETVTIQREVIHVETVLGDTRKTDDSWNFMLDDEKKIGYIRITAFGRDTAAEVRKAVVDLEKQKMRGLIVDLRFNPGGLLRSAIEVADLFISEGLIVSTKGRNTVDRPVHAKKAGTLGRFPMAILVNRYSASASEIVSACLQDHKRAVVIGERTWGKGSVQNVIDLEGGRSALKLTTASYWRPNGHNIHRFPGAKDSDEWGVMPDQGYEVKLSDAELGELVRYRRDRDILRESHAPAAQEQAAAEDKPAAEAGQQKRGRRPGKTEVKEPVGTDKPAAGKPGEDKPEGTEPKPAEADETPPEANDAGKTPPGDQEPAKVTAEDRSGESPQVVDRQLQKALEYLSTELARAG